MDTNSVTSSTKIWENGGFIAIYKHLLNVLNYGVLIFKLWSTFAMLNNFFFVTYLIVLYGGEGIS